MIIGKYFKDDEDEVLMLYQHDCYYDSLRRWIKLAGECHCQYHRLPEWEDISRQWDMFRERGYHDHRCIQAHHDLIAKRFRMIQKNPDLFFWIVHGKNGWFDFFNSEIAKFMKDPEMLRLFMTAVACANTKAGYDAEDELLDKMRESYGVGKCCIPVVPES
ncbi:MAG: hypothetical protein J0665_08425 [Deltaproteobacteria bacterium]|jgi:hypothetical protein|nr:hypothetical protein [Deltaproteobacteria bacterium]